MRLRLLRLRWHRRLRKGQRQVEDLSQLTEEGIERHLFKRFSRLAPVRRFVLGWMGLLILLIAAVLLQTIRLSGYFQKLQPVPGGIYNEGILGTFTTANPLYATNDVDSSVARLMFAGLLTYNEQNQLVGDLASSWQTNSTGNVYTVHLKPGLTWQDGQPLTSADVVFTFQTIQNPDAKSPLQNSWSGVTITAPDSQTVVFALTDPLASFPYNLTTGIVPKHLLDKILPSDLRSADFNTVNPVGAGPFAWQALQVAGTDPSNAQEQVSLTAFKGYQAGPPKLQAMVVHAYADQNELERAFKSRQLDGLEGLNGVPASLRGDKAMQVHSPLLTAANMVFFKTSTGVLSDAKVRQALVQGANVPAIINSLDYSTHAVNEPLLTNQLGYNPAYKQAGYNLAAAKQTLDQDGWTVTAHGPRAKAGQQLKFTLTAADTPEARQVTKQLQRDWHALGVNMQLNLLNADDFQSALTSHQFDAILYGISIGVDPDVFVYWDSSQADPRSTNYLNLSAYKNPGVDVAVEGGRTRIDPALRVIKYQPLLQAWSQDNPALGLYQPRLLYLTNGSVAGLHDHAINTATDRFDNVVNWEIRQAKVTY
ncbi:MAG TPA: ABC transporter substrate-binding protein [Candidatus Saccharimonadales bacterium]|nr:ABC transporter substrate-binding protein [Candidatus Saccharimonadales bacterium]